MHQENIKDETAGGLVKDIMPSPPAIKWTLRQTTLSAGIAGAVLLIAVFVYCNEFIAPHEVAYGAFIDGYGTLISLRMPGQVARLMVTGNREVKAGDVLVEIDARDCGAG